MVGLSLGILTWQRISWSKSTIAICMFYDAFKSDHVCMLTSRDKFMANASGALLQTLIKKVL